jgi:type I restriction enzyme M protein
VANERATEDIVREHFKKHGLPQQRLEEQASSIPLVKTALATASKQSKGIGKPEFIITFPVIAPQTRYRCGV